MPDRLHATTPFHAGAVRAAERWGKPWRAVATRTDMPAEIAQLLPAGPVYVVVTDPRFAPTYDTGRARERLERVGEPVTASRERQRSWSGARRVARCARVAALRRRSPPRA